MKSAYEFASQLFLVDLTPNGQGKSYRFTVGDRAVDVEVLQAKDGKLDLLIDGRHLTAYVSADNARRWTRRRPIFAAW